MDIIIERFLSLPSFVTYAATGATGGLVGWMIGSLINRRLNAPKAVGIASVVCIVAAIQLTNQFLPRLQEFLATEMAMAGLEKNRLLQVIFRHHPEAEQTLRAEMAQAMADRSDKDGSQAFFRMQAASARIVEQYFPRYLGLGSDEVTYRLLKRQVEVIARFRDKPKLCVNYYLGLPEFERNDLTLEFVAEESNLKADLIESAMADPSALKPAESLETVLVALLEGYNNRGHPVEDMDKLSLVSTLPPEEGCKIAFEFVDALASLGPERSPHIFKSLIRLGQEQQ